eukprot:CAMPEP_0172643498 /NCGR_PEP_ID=MMETSP1068-20121228/237133_1 /TAXON_ID=35684 /ORGANISM="Pseudopedinella elastica, Strain CCMP716" /LENGTH=49 /DNA_ID= /DNA_START= /DNA_END= /DNA_ORIENTATION=
MGYPATILVMIGLCSTRWLLDRQQSAPSTSLEAVGYSYESVFLHGQLWR